MTLQPKSFNTCRKDKINVANITRHKDDVLFLQFSKNGKYFHDYFLL